MKIGAVAKFYLGYILGTPASQPHIQVAKPYQNETILQGKTTKSKTCSEQEKEFE